MGEFEQNLLRSIFSQSSDVLDSGEKKRKQKINPDFFIEVGAIPTPLLLKKIGIKSRFYSQSKGAMSLVILCPFHEEKIPSLIFYRNGTWRCHGCGEGGDLLTFTILYFGWNKTKTIRWFHRNFGIPLPWKSAKERRLEKTTKK